MTETIHIAVAMKPLDGNFARNALEHGVAGLNIDGSRVAYVSDEDRRESCDKQTVKPIGGFSDKDGTLYGTSAGVVYDHPVGRFPANVVLAHGSNCEMLGDRKVKGALITKPCPSPEIRREGWGTLQGNRGRRGHGDEDGTETIADWECSCDCPVSLLDEQSGVRPGCKSPSNAKPENKFRPNQGNYMPQGPIHPDIGGASRYFRQFREK